MAINVTPIPRLTTFGAPGFTLGTSNAGGDSQIAVASNSTLLAYDTTVPAETLAVSATGSATTSARRDHVHGDQVKAWGMMSADGTLNSSFNIDSGSKASSGRYDFVITTDLSSGLVSAVASAYSGSFFNCTTVVATTDIDVYTFNSGHGLADVAFSMICCGTI